MSTFPLAIRLPTAALNFVDVAVKRASSVTFKLSYEDSMGTIPAKERVYEKLYLLVPGIGDTRHQYEQFLPSFIAASGQKSRFLVMDLRGTGNGEAPLGETSYTPNDVADDMDRVIQHAQSNEQPQSKLDLTIIGNSLAASSACIYTSLNVPLQASRLVLLGPILHDNPNDWGFKLIVPILFSPLWGAGLWVQFYDTLYAQAKPEWFAAYRERLKKHLQEKGRLGSLVRLIRASKTDAWKQAVPQVKIPVLAIYGDKDPDYKNVPEEMAMVKEQFKACSSLTLETLSNVGHYPHVEAVEATVRLICKE